MTTTRWEWYGPCPTCGAQPRKPCIDQRVKIKLASVDQVGAMRRKHSARRKLTLKDRHAPS